MIDEFIIPDESAIKEKRKEGDKKISALTEGQVKLLRHESKNDLFFLCHGILGFKKLSPNLHNHFCKWLEFTKYEQFREKLLPRGHYKTTVATIGDSIQRVLPDDSGFLKYPHNLGPNLRQLIAHETSIGSSRILYQLVQHFMANPLLMALYPELVPSPKINRINQNELELPRQIIASEPTFDTMGVAGKSQGRHYNGIKCDDLYGAAARDSAAERESTIQWIDNLQSFLITPKTDYIDFIGTRYAFDDCYAHIHEVYGKRLHKYIRSCEEVIDGKKVPIFPEEFPPESLEILKKNKQIWNAQYSNNPSEGATKWQEGWLRYYNKLNPREVVIFNGEERIRIPIEKMDKIIFIDPAITGLTGITVTGTDHKGRIIVLEAIKETLEPDALTNRVFQLVLKYNPRLVVIEEVLFSKVYQPWWIREMSFRKVKFHVEGAKTKGKEKDERISILTPYYSAGQIYVDATMTEFIEEFRQFGATTNIHMHDSMAYGPRYWRTYVDVPVAQKVEMAMGSLGVDPETGYSIMGDD